MTMTDFIAAAVILVIAAAAAGYIYKAKKRGAKCIGCPSAASCGAHKQAAVDADRHEAEGGCCCGCHAEEN